MAKIEIYYAEVCGLCHKAMDFFRSRDLPFLAHEIVYDKEADAFVDDENYRALKERVGGEVEFVPQIFVHETHHIPGWRQLEPMIESGEFDALLSGGEWQGCAG